MIDRTVRARLDAIRARIAKQTYPVGPWEARLARHVGDQQYEFETDWTPVTAPCQWPAGKTVFMRTQWSNPAAKSDEKKYLRFSAEALEGLLSVDGRPYAGVDWGHDAVPAPEAETALLELEFIVRPESQWHPHLLTEPGRFNGCSLVLVDGRVEELYYFIAFAWDAVCALPDGRVRQRLAAAVEDALLRVNPKDTGKEFDWQVLDATVEFNTQLGDIGKDPERGTLVLTGHSHIDTAWLWPLRETVRKCARTFATACRLMDRYLGYHFSCSQAQLYRYVELHFPTLLDEIKRHVENGCWETTGAWWVEADCNVTSGESLIRQALYGIRFFQRHFGTRPRLCWLPDVFGYPASLPTILKGCGIDYFYTNKLHWHATNEFPYHLFRWRGTDGSEVLAHTPNHECFYNGQVMPGELRTDWERFHEKGLHDEVLVPFGHGDGGGGPTMRMLEYAREAHDFPGVPQVRQERAENYFSHAEYEAKNLPCWWGELYLENHRGTYTTQSAMKRANRKAELLYRDTEILASCAQAAGKPVDARHLQSGWETVLTHQFHDILPGSSIGQVYKEGLANLAGATDLATDVKAAALAALGAQPREEIGDRFIVVNTLSWPRSDPVEVTAKDPGGEFVVVNEQTKQELPAQVIERKDGQVRFVFCPDEARGIGWATFAIKPGQGRKETSLHVSKLDVTSRFFEIAFNSNGEITRLVDRRTGKQLVPDGAPVNELQLFQDPDEAESAWNLNKEALIRRYSFDGEGEIAVREHGPVRTVLHATRRYKTTRIEQDIIVYDTLPRIDFVTTVDWQARETLLKVAFPADVLAREATCEIQFGTVARPTHRNTSWDQEKFEVCAHRWVDLSQADCGVSVLNDCKYGHDVLGQTMRISLLRGTAFPDPNADRGTHRFTYALLPHGGDWRVGRTVRTGWELNAPMIPVAAGEAPNTGLFIELDAFSTVIEAVKPAEDGRGLILRVYESNGGCDHVTVRMGFDPTEIIVCNHVEEDTEEKIECNHRQFSFEMGPYQVRSFRVV